MSIQSFSLFKLQVATMYGREGVEIVNNFYNKKLRDIISNMDGEEFNLFHLKIEENLTQIEELLASCIKRDCLPKEKSYNHDEFYQRCYKELSDLIKNKKYGECEYLAKVYKLFIINIRKNIEAMFSKGSFANIYTVKDEEKIEAIEQIYKLKKSLEKIGIILTLDEILLIINSDNPKETLLSLMNSISKLPTDVELILEQKIKLTEGFSKKELEIYLHVIEGLSETPPIKEENLLNTIYDNNNIYLVKQ